MAFRSADLRSPSSPSASSSRPGPLPGSRTANRNQRQPRVEPQISAGFQRLSTRANHPSVKLSRR
jgi:hypothetical protein